MTRRKTTRARKTTPRVQATNAIKITYRKGPLPTLAEMEAALVRLAVERSDTQAEAAALLGISVKKLQLRLRRLDGDVETT